MNLTALAKAQPSPAAWSELTAALDQKRPSSHQVSALSRLLRDWPPWMRVFPVPWFSAVAEGSHQPWYALATDVDVGHWAYTLHSPGAYSHEMAPGYELDKALAAFADSPAMAGVRRIRTCHEGGTSLLAHADRLLDIALVAEVREPTVRTLIDAPWTSSLHSLVAENRDRDVPAALWPELAGRFQALRELRLRSVDCHADFVRALFDNRRVKLERLVLSSLRLGDEGVEALLAGKPRKLEELTLWGPGPSAETLVRLVQHSTLRTLRSLSLQSQRAGDSLAIALSESPTMDDLEQLDLRGNGLTDGGVAMLVMSRRASRLRSLTLRGNPFSDVGARAIARSPHLSKLEHLNIREANIGPQGLRALMESDTLPALKVVNIMHNPGAEVMRTKLEARFERIIDVSARG